MLPYKLSFVKSALLVHFQVHSNPLIRPTDCFQIWTLLKVIILKAVKPRHVWEINVRCWSCVTTTNFFGLTFLKQVSVLQNANLASGAHGVPVWRRTKHVDLRKARSLGFVCPFCRPTARTPPRLLYPRRPVLHRRRKWSALWPRRPVWEVNTHLVQKPDILGIERYFVRTSP